jgi:hypothetical protein
MFDEGKTLPYFAITMGDIRNSNLPKYVFFATRLGTAVLSLSLQTACSGLMRRLYLYTILQLASTHCNAN